MSASSASFSRWEYQNIALAAVAQSAALVHGLATRGTAPESDVVATINPLLCLNPASVAAVYPNVSHLSLGLRTLQAMFSNERAKENAELVRYTLGILILRNKLDVDEAMQQRLRRDLQAVSPLRLSYESAREGEDEATIQSEQERTFEQLAALYQDTISTLPYRIQVQGKLEYLKDEHIANRIRALLLAGIRSAVLWHQLGGRRWRLVFFRKNIQSTAGNIRRKLIATV